MHYAAIGKVKCEVFLKLKIVLKFDSVLRGLLLFPD